MDILEGTYEFNRHYRQVTGEIPITVHNGGDGMTPDMVTAKPVAFVNEEPVHDMEDFAAAMEGIDDQPIVATCNTENPEMCEACD